MNLRHLTLHQLRIFHAVARCGSFAKAAQALHLSPPALSLQVKQLSQSIGQPLFEQLGKRIFLTTAGHTLADACADIDRRLEQLGQDLLAQQGVEQGQLRVAILTTLKYSVPKLLGRFCREHPGIDVSLFVGNRGALLQRLKANEDDLYIMGQAPDHLDVISTPFADNPLIAIAAPDHPLAGKRTIPAERLAKEPFIMREPESGTRLTTERFFAERGLELINRLELGSNEAIKQTVAGGLGVAVLSAHTVQAELALGDLVQLDVRHFPLLRRWYVLRHSGKRLSPAAQAFERRLYEGHHNG
jgi:DNA-binding transcriptional LysR family regulator